MDDELIQELILLRKKLHSNPELSGKETITPVKSPPYPCKLPVKLPLLPITLPTTVKSPENEPYVA